MEEFAQHTTLNEVYDDVERRPASTASVCDIVEQKRKRYSKSRDIFSIEEVNDRKARKRLYVQRSLSLPDVVPSTSPVFDESPSDDSPSSPDIVYHVDQKGFQKKKFEIEGHVHKPRPKSVSFLDKSCENVSAHGKVGRQQLRKKKPSSGYGSSESNISTDVIYSGEKNQDVNTGSVDKGLTGNNKATSKPISDSIPTISLFVFNSSGSVYVNEEIVNQLKCYDTGLAPASRTPQSTESVSPLSQYCYDRLTEEKNESVTENKLNQPTRHDIRREEGKLKKELYHGEFERRMLSNKVSVEKFFSFSESTTPSPHDIVNTGSKRNNDGKIPSLPQPKSLDLFGKEECLCDPSLPDALENYCNCYNKALCPDNKCNEIQSAIEDLRSCIDNQLIPTSTITHQILHALRIHSRQCNHDICPVPWCNVLNTLNDWSIKHAVTVLSDYESTLTGCKQLKEYIQISTGYRCGYIEGIDWLSLMPLNKKKNVIIAENLRKTNIQDTRWVIKKTNLNDYNQQLSVYTRLRQFISPYIVQHYWACECGSRELLICTRFMSGIPLNEIIMKTHSDEKDICLWMCHVITGVLHLHKYDIIYLKWTSKNIMVNDNPNDCLKITDLSCSVVSSHRQAYYHEIKQLLPPTIFPPEIDDVGAEINEKSDSWGCACLLYELFTSFPVFHHLCHLKKDQMWKQMKLMQMPHLPKTYKKYQPILDTLWRKPIDDRATLETVLSQLHDLYKS